MYLHKRCSVDPKKVMKNNVIIEVPKGIRIQEPGGKINQDTGDKLKCCTILKRAVLQVSVQEGFKGKLHERTDLSCQGTIGSCL